MPEFAARDETFISPAARAVEVAAILAVIVPPGNDTGVVVSPGGVTRLLQAARTRTNASKGTGFTKRKLGVELEGGNSAEPNLQQPTTANQKRRKPRSAISAVSAP